LDSVWSRLGRVAFFGFGCVSFTLVSTQKSSNTRLPLFSNPFSSVFSHIYDIFLALGAFSIVRITQGASVMIEIEYVLDRPLSGETTEINFGEGSEFLWVRFRDETFDEWIGKFELGNTSEKGIGRLNETTSLILAQGNIFIVELTSRRVIKQIEGDSFYGFYISNEFSRIILNDALRLFVFDFQGNEICRTRRFSLDGISFGELRGSVIFGSHNDCSDEWGTYSFDFVQNHLECSWSME